MIFKNKNTLYNNIRIWSNFCKITNTNSCHRAVLFSIWSTKEKKWAFAITFISLIYFKLRSNRILSLKYQGLRHWVAKITGLEKKSLWQRFNFFISLHIGNSKHDYSFLMIENISFCVRIIKQEQLQIGELNKMLKLLMQISLIQTIRKPFFEP